MPKLSSFSHSTTARLLTPENAARYGNGMGYLDLSTHMPRLKKSWNEKKKTFFFYFTCRAWRIPYRRIFIICCYSGKINIHSVKISTSCDIARWQINGWTDVQQRFSNKVPLVTFWYETLKSICLYFFQNCRFSS